MNRPTRFFSSKQEKKIAKAVQGKQVANSGATKFQKGDVVTDDWLFEAKTKTSKSNSFTIKKEWITKNKEEAFTMRKEHSAVVIDFGDGEQYYILDEKTFLELMKGD
jgi:uncharacterized membrane protein